MGGRYKQLLDNLQEKKEYWKLKQEALNHTHFGRGYGTVIRQATE